MRVMKKVAPLTAAAAMMVSPYAVSTAQAEVTAGLGVASMYLWRGQNVSDDAPQVSGELKFSTPAGPGDFYAGVWTSNDSSEDAGHETDIFFGFSTKAGPIDLDISYWNYLYPEARADVDLTVPNTNTVVTIEGGAQSDLGDSDAAEIVISASFGPGNVTLYHDVDSDGEDYDYITLSYSMDSLTFTYGMWSMDGAGKSAFVDTDGNGTLDDYAVGADEYSHLTVTYAATDDLSFSLSKAFSDLDGDTDPAAVEEDFLVQVSYGWSFDIKK